MDRSDDRMQRALERCASEPVQQPGAIQPAGFLFAVDTGFRRISHVSAGIGDHLGIDARWENLPSGCSAARC